MISLIKMEFIFCNQKVIDFSEFSFNDFLLIGSIKIEQPSNQADKNLKLIKKLQTDISEIRSSIAQLNPETFPRFMAWKSGTITSRKHDPLIFNEIKYNDDKMYNEKTGIVTIKYDGMYLFNVNLIKKPNSGSVSFYIVINGGLYAKSDK